MAFFKYLLPLVILVASYPHVSYADDATNLIHQTCKNTRYYDLCVSSLQSNSSSATNADARGFALIMINIAIANATATNSYISSQVKGIGNDKMPMKVAMMECGEKYKFSNEALQNAVVDLNGERYDYAYMHVMAAADYPSGCRNGFRRCPELVYPTILAVREDNLKHICDVVLGIVDSIGF